MRRMFWFGVPPILVVLLRILENAFTPLLAARTDLSRSHVLNDYTGLEGVRKHKHVLHKEILQTGGQRQLTVGKHFCSV